MVSTALLKKWNVKEWMETAASQVPEYFYVPCEDISQACKPELKQYFRLYRKTKEGPVLIAQGTSNEGWEEKYEAKFIGDPELKPYPHLD